MQGHLPTFTLTYQEQRMSTPLFARIVSPPDLMGPHAHSGSNPVARGWATPTGQPSVTGPLPGVGWRIRPCVSAPLWEGEGLQCIWTDVVLPKEGWVLGGQAAKPVTDLQPPTKKMPNKGSALEEWLELWRIHKMEY